MTKNLNEIDVGNELEGSAYFVQKPPPPKPPQAKNDPKAIASSSRKTNSRYEKKTTEAPDQNRFLDEIRRCLKASGKEAATHRFTLAEKQEISEIRHGFYKSGIRTSENEITRIAINSLLKDYQENGDDSTLSRVLSLLHE